MTSCKLIIAEKPSLARNIMAAIGSGKFQKRDGYFESSEYIVTWAFGHLFSLKDVEDYKPKDSREGHPKWTLEDLPFRPNRFQFELRKQGHTGKVDPAIRKQFKTIQKICARPDVSAVIHAGDADREGEIIVRIILKEAGNKKPVMRLWMPDQTSATIQSELRTMRSDAKYDRLADEGYSRTYIDWLYGINLTRLATIKSGRLLRVGRVIVPIVKTIYDRDMEIRNFVPQKYFGIVSKAKTNGEVIELSGKKKFDPGDLISANELCSKYNLADAVVSDIKTEEKTISPGKLYSLSTLQGVLGKKYKMSPKESLAILQSLYEKGFVTYPRTNSEYLATAERGKINSILKQLKAKGYKVTDKDSRKSIYDDNKIESHSALTPTGNLASKSDLKPKEWQVYSTILDRFLAVFCAEDCKVNRTVITIAIRDGSESFSLKGDIFLSKGWMQYEESTHKERILPQLKIGEMVNIDFKPVEKETSPPNHYTVDSLNKYLKNPFRKELSEDTGEDQETTDEQEYKAIFEGVELGTEATRTSIIENAIHSEYISLKNNTYTILPEGEFLIESLDQLGIQMDKSKTAQLGRALKQVYRGELSVEKSVDLAYQEISQYFENSKSAIISYEGHANIKSLPVLGKCPKCDGEVVERKKLYGCYNRDCKFALWKDDRFFASRGKNLTGPMVKQMLSKGRIKLKGCISQKSGKKYACTVYVNFSGQYPQYKIEFENSK